MSKIIAKTASIKSVRKETGFVLWEGQSPATGEPIVAIATVNSKNDKTGDMIQTWIIRQDIAPIVAVKTATDLAVCGNCPLAGGNGCYVETAKAPGSIWRKYTRGGYRKVSPDKLHLVGAGKLVRLGAYGDPAMVPLWVWESLLRKSEGHTGYTHQWTTHWFDKGLLKFCMASANNPNEAGLLAELGIRYFIGLPEDSELPIGAIQCPNDTKGIQCKDCLLCSGGKTGKSIAVAIHGPIKKATLAMGHIE